LKKKSKSNIKTELMHRSKCLEGVSAKIKFLIKDLKVQRKKGLLNLVSRSGKNRVYAKN
jgi:hypothetical protein